MSSSESESTQVIEEETRRLSGIQQFTIPEQEQEEENKKREKNKSYRLLKEYEDYEQASNDLKDFKLNGFKLKYHQFNSDKHYYKCEKSCPVRMYLVLDQESSRCTLYATRNTEHIHEE